MADKFSQRVNAINGISYDVWFQKYVKSVDDFEKGELMECKNINGQIIKRPINSCAILLKDCSFQRQGTKNNYGKGGSNAITGNPIDFIDIMTVFPDLFAKKQNGILSGLHNAYAIPLCLINEFPGTKTVMDDYASKYVSQGVCVSHDDTHIANMICSVFAAICFNLSSEITVNGKTPDSKRILFLTNAFYSLTRTAKSVAKFSYKANKLMRLMPYVPRPADTFQATIMAFIFNEQPHISIKVNQIALAIRRFFHYSGENASFIKTNPTGLIGLLLIIPKISSLIDDTEIQSQLESEEGNKYIKVINDIVKAINETVEGISKHIKEHYTTEMIQVEIHSINKMILTKFASASSNPLIPTELVGKIYDTVRQVTPDKDIADILGITETLPFIKTSDLTLNKVKNKNFPVLVKTEINIGNDCPYAGTWVPSDSREWTGLVLKKIPEYEHVIICDALGLSNFETGNSLGNMDTANFRITLGNEIMSSNYPGISVSGMIYNPVTKKYNMCLPSEKIDPHLPIVIRHEKEHIVIKQEKAVKYVIPISDPDTTALFCFKYCSVNIKTRLIKNETETETETQGSVINSCKPLSCVLSA
jgi:hypothetical protein